MSESILQMKGSCCGKASWSSSGKSASASCSSTIMPKDVRGLRTRKEATAKSSDKKGDARFSASAIRRLFSGACGV